MKPFWVALLVAGSAAFGQQRPNPAGFGSVLYPGTGGPPGNNIYSRRPTNLVPPPRLQHPGHARNVIVPVPVIYGGYYDPSAGYEQQPAPYEDPSQYAAPSQAPVMIMSPNYREAPQPMYRETPAAPPQQDQVYRPDAPATIYLIALTDHTILPAIAYWVDGDTLSYITPEGDQNRASLALVDRDFSKKLNDERQVEFKLPKQ